MTWTVKISKFYGDQEFCFLSREFLNQKFVKLLEKSASNFASSLLLWVSDHNTYKFS